MVTLALGAGLLTGCEFFNDPSGNGEIPEGLTFFTGANLSFYFVDGEGKDMIVFTDETTYPVVWSQKLVNERALQEMVYHVDQVYQDDRDYRVYANSHNWVSYDPDVKLNALGAHLWGKTLEKQYTSYVHIGDGIIDSLTVAYKYLTSADDVQIQGGSWAVEIESIRYNGVEVMLGNENGKVFIQKPSRDETVVHIGRL